jgi:8-oxo-dGTP pyrophosphatase MutT (NUDIX family)
MYPNDSVISKKAPVRYIVGIVVFDGEKFLLLHRKLNWVGWEFPKGGINTSESPEESIKRELFEETGLKKFELVSKIDFVTHFDSIRKMESHVQNYLVRVSSNNKITFENQAQKHGKKIIEHDDFKWCFPQEAVKLLKHQNMKETMKKAIKLLGLEMEK